MIIKETDSTPLVKLSIEECLFEIKGFSFSNEADFFYKPILEWIDKEIPMLECELNCEFYIPLFNSTTFKYLLNMMAKFKRFTDKGKKIKVTWYYDPDDDDNADSAQDIRELFNIPFELKEYIE